jgi:thiamine pyrophosphokinase
MSEGSRWQEESGTGQVMSKFAILLGGNVTPTQRLKSQLEGARVIAADSGMAHARTLGVMPELWVGDFDSASPELLTLHANVERQVFPSEKDATDGDIAISEAFRRGATSIIMVGGFGGQFDHTLSHAAMLLALAKREVPCMISSGDEEAQPLMWETMVTGLAPGTRLSIVPMSDIKGLTITGVKWPLTNKSVPFGSTLTLSNITTSDVAIEVHVGTGLVIAYPQEGA